MLTALTRAVPDSLAAATLTYRDFEPIDAALAREQHLGYERALARAGVRVGRLPARHDLPDSVFVEDAALVLDEVAVLAPMGSEARARESDALAPVLAPLRPLLRLRPPARLDGGDVLRVGRTLYVGRSRRTNDQAAAQLRAALAGHGYEVVPVAVEGALHLKTGCAYAGDNVLLVNPDWVDVAPFKPFELLPVHPEEPWAANVLPVAGRLLASLSFPRTLDALGRRGFDVEPLDVSELHKAEGGLTCLSLLFESDAPLPEGVEERPRLER